MRTACSVPGCPEYAVVGGRGRCPSHYRTTSERGYDTTHVAARARLACTLPAPCAYGCGVTLRRGDPWVAAHVKDGVPQAGWVAGCLRCNERAKNGELQPISSAIVVHVSTAPSHPSQLRRRERGETTTKREEAVPFA